MDQSSPAMAVLFQTVFPIVGALTAVVLFMSPAPQIWSLQTHLFSAASNSHSVAQLARRCGQPSKEGDKVSAAASDPEKPTILAVDMTDQDLNDEEDGGPVESATPHINPFPYVLMVANTLVWLQYALLTRNAYIFVPNVYGFLVSLVYTIVCMAHMARSPASAAPVDTILLLPSTSLSSSLSGGESVSTSEETRASAHSIAPLRPNQAITLGPSGPVPSQPSPLASPRFKIPHMGRRSHGRYFWSLMGLLLCCCFAIFICSFLAVVVFAGQPAQAQRLMGSVAVIILTLFYAAPLSDLMRVLRTRNASLFYWPLSLTTVGNGVLWSVYGLAVGDAFVWGPNLLGAVLGSVQLALIVLFRPSAR